MQLNNGIKFENQFINSIDGKTYQELPDAIKNFISHSFNNVDLNSVFHAEHCDPQAKPDVMINYKGETHFVSLKTGKARILHAEQLSKFADKLDKAGIPPTYIETVKKFHYGDGTTDGSGTERLGYDRLFPKMYPEICTANLYLNDNINFIVDFVDTLMFKGNNPNLPVADFIYHGTMEKGVFTSRIQVLKYVRCKHSRFEYIRNLHIGPIHFTPYARYADKTNREDYEYKRDIVTFSWPNLIADIEYISKWY